MTIRREIQRRHSFPAEYFGRCNTCGDQINIGDQVFYPLNASFVSGIKCCGDVSDVDLANFERNETSTGDLDVPRDQVMPRGRTVRDRCGTCFIIPSSNGVCGCG